MGRQALVERPRKENGSGYLEIIRDDIGNIQGKITMLMSEPKESLLHVCTPCTYFGAYK